MLSKTVFPLIAALLGSILAHATSFLPRPFDEALKEAPILVRGKVGNQYTEWVNGTGDARSIFTFYQLNIDEIFKGDIQGSSLIFRQIGGEKDGVGLQVPGSASFQSGEDVVVMLGTRNSDGSYDLQGLSTGKYTVDRNSSGQEVLLGAGVQDLTIPPELRPGHRSAAIHPGEDHDDSPGSTLPDQSKWTLDAVRHLTHGSKKPVKPNASPEPSPSPISSERAPQLQPSSAAENSAATASGLGKAVWIELGLGGLVMLLGLIWLRRK